MGWRRGGDQLSVREADGMIPNAASPPVAAHETLIGYKQNETRL
jgi:hypothetical protein